MLPDLRFIGKPSCLTVLSGLHDAICRILLSLSAVRSPALRLLPHFAGQQHSDV